jgi:hypothetical protein
MSPTDIAAWVGALSGVAALAWDFYKWKFSGPKLEVSTNYGMKVAGPHAKHDNSDYISIWVRNTGTAKTTISTLWVVTYDSWWAQKRGKRLKAAVIPYPAPGVIPSELDVGSEWVGAIRQSKEINEMLRSGKMWCEVFHSWSKNPTRAHIKLKP